jgi:hypothetical protein
VLIYLITAFSSLMRDDPSPRYFITVLPFFALIIVEAFRCCPGNRIKWVLAASVVFFQLSYLVNTSNFFTHFKNTEYSAKKFLSQKNLDDTLVLYNSEFYPVFQSDLGTLGAPEEFYDGSRFLLFDPFPPEDTGLGYEACVKALDLTWKMKVDILADHSIELGLGFPARDSIDEKENILYYELFERLGDGARPARGPHYSYGGYAIFAPRILNKSQFPSSRGYWYNSTPTVLGGYQAGREPDLDSLAGRRLPLIFHYSESYLNLPPWLESIPVMLLMGQPPLTPVESVARIHRTSSSQLGCRDKTERIFSDLEERLSGKKKMKR